MSLSVEESILAGLFLCSDKSHEILAALKPEWNEKTYLPLEEKLLIINCSFLITQIFPWKEELSDGIDYEKFCESFFTQPDLFLRLRPGNEEIVIQKLKKAGIEFQIITGSCLALPNNSKVDSVIAIDKEAVIQDYSSQQVGRYLIDHQPPTSNQQLKIWDCCAGSGGKSIMAYDLNPAIELTVSDVRESILANLKKRFQIAGIKKYKSAIIDLTKPDAIQHSIINNQQSIIICDTPCTGSGTWSRTPEQLYFFNENKIEEYALLQKRIASNVIPYLQSGGSLIYITCSVFRKENEEVVEFIKQKSNLQLKHMELLKGYEKKADSMFVAVFTS